ncbi:MAG: NADH-quinone oxidoreductase subunit NuoN [Alphaproteobacteria bacterium]
MINLTVFKLEPIFPEIFLAISMLITLMIGVFKKNSEKIISYLCVIILIITFGSILAHNITEKEIILNGFYTLDSFEKFSKMLLVLSTIMIIIIYNSNQINKRFNFEFPILIVFSLLGMMIMISANDFITLYLGFELQSLCLYVLASYDKDNDISSEAGIKYFILGALASAILLFGISLIYGFSGTTNFSLFKYDYLTIESNFPIPLGLLIGLIMVIIGLAFKISASPFHMWTPDVYQGAPNIVTAFFSAVPKAASILLLTKLLFDPFNRGWINQWQQIIILISSLSMIVGAIGALNQTDFKRLLAYSSIGHVGYILMGLSTGNKTGVDALLLYLVVYVITSLGVFNLILNISKLKNIEINDLKGFSKKYPFASFGLAALLLSMAGIPPFAGFFTKFYIFKSVIEVNLYFLAILGIITSVISTYYYLKIIKIMYFDDIIENSQVELICSKTSKIFFIASVIINMFFMGIIDKSYLLINAASKSFFHGN